MNKKWLALSVGAAVVLSVGTFFLLKRSADRDRAGVTASSRFESSTPSQGEALPAPPPNVTIDFNLDLADSSEIHIIFGGDIAYNANKTTVDANRLAMRTDMLSDAPDGTYTVIYTACWLDGSCDHGQFAFTIDRSLQDQFTDLTKQKEVTIRMSQIMFAPSQIKISQGTKVTWVNDEAVTHYVNTNAHPSHTHVPEFNSRALEKDDRYSFTFDKPGAYPYHCSAHAHTMTGMIVVI